MASGFEVNGLDNLMRHVGEMGRKGEGIENTALKKAGQVFLNEIKSRAPKSPQPRTPKPKTQLWRTGKHASEILKIGGIKKSNGRKYVLVGIQKSDNSKAFYLKFKEFGSSKEAAKPFVAPAYESKKSEAKEVIKEELRRGLGLK